MKSNTFNYSLLAVGVAALMGVSTGANAATPANAATAGAAPINNQATASYSVANVVQPDAKSNTVTVNVSETANFALVSTVDDGSTGNDTATNQTATPGGTTTFTHALTNTGNVTDTYTVNTTGNDSLLVTATPDYALGTALVTFTIVQADGTALTPAQVTALNGQAQTGTIANGGTIRLQPGTRANLSYASATPVARNGNDKGVGTLTATSTFFTNSNTAGATLVNENQTIVRLPTFKIAKTATSTVDLTATTPQIVYSIVVTNATTDYSATATDFVIRDVLPAGLSLPNNAASDVTVTGGAGNATISTINSRRAIDVAVANLPVGESRTITFTVNVDRAQYAGANSSVTNNVEVYDKFAGQVGTLPASPVLGTNYDILDSTNNNLDVTRVPATADQTGGAGVDTAGVTNFTRRSLTLAQGTVREIAPTTSTANTDGQVTHVATITNLGQDVEGDANNPLTLTITDGSNAAVDPVLNQFFLVYTPPGGTASAPITVTPTRNGNVYTISSDQFLGGIPKDGKLEVRYNMSSNAAVIGSSESTVVKLTAGGTNAPTIPSITDITNVKGLTLLKQAAVQVNCTGTIPAYQGALGAPTTISDTAKPGDCIYYKITANNTFTSTSGTAINNIVLSDLTSHWKPKSTYQPTTASSSTGGPNTVTVANSGTAATEAVTTTLPTLAAGASGNLTFAIKVNP